jgi:hypothetical protein
VVDAWAAVGGGAEDVGVGAVGVDPHAAIAHAATATITSTLGVLPTAFPLTLLHPRTSDAGDRCPGEAKSPIE